MATWKNNLIIAGIVGVLLAVSFFSGAQFEQYRCKKNSDQSISRLQSKLDNANETIRRLESENSNSLQYANEQRKQLESIKNIISNAKQFIAKYANESGDINSTVANIEISVGRITEDFNRIERIVESGGTQSDGNDGDKQQSD